MEEEKYGFCVVLLENMEKQRTKGANFDTECPRKIIRHMLILI